LVAKITTSTEYVIVVQGHFQSSKQITPRKSVGLLKNKSWDFVALADWESWF